MAGQKGGSLKSIKGARSKRASLETKVAELEKLVSRLVAHYDAQVNRIRESIQELTRANNASSLVVATFEAWLDEKHPGWDDGKREAMREKAVLLAERQALVLGIQKGESNEQRAKAAERLLAVCREVGTESTDVPVVVSAFVKNRDAERALEVIRFARKTGVEIAPEYAALFKELEDKVGAMTGKSTALEAIEGGASDSDEDPTSDPVEAAPEE